MRGKLHQLKTAPMLLFSCQPRRATLCDITWSSHFPQGSLSGGCWSRRLTTCCSDVRLAVHSAPV